MEYETINGRKEGNIFYLTLNRPEKRNAINLKMMEEICQMVENLARDPEVRVIIMKGEGKTFSAGADFNFLGDMITRFTEADYASGGASIRSELNGAQNLFNRLESVEIPIIAAIHGVVFGLSTELSLVCDIRLMSDNCLWGLQEAKVGVVADVGGTSRLNRLLGAPRAFEVMATADKFSAQQALDWGFVSYVYPEEKLFDEAQALAERIAKNSPMAVGAIKRIFKKGESLDLMTQIDMEATMNSILFRTEDFKNGVNSLITGQTPKWQRK